MKCESCRHRDKRAVKGFMYNCSQFGGAFTRKEQCDKFVLNKGLEHNYNKKVFVASSSSKMPHLIANTVVSCFHNHNFEATAWKDFFEPTKSTLENLIQKLRQYAAGVFIFSPEDSIKKGDKECLSVRDNVIFECGLCLGLFGLSKTFILCPPEVCMPTDLSGVGRIEYNSSLIKKDEDVAEIISPLVDSKIIPRLG
jgi:predicted nucleotide-binding protein